jgi:pyruvate dehydrogenase E2 component (dihydrolipoamide acetyltransferase)
MAYEFKLPDLGEGLTEGEIARWLVVEGQELAEDDPLVEIATDKTTVEIPSPAAGTVTRILVGEGEVVPVGTVLVVIGGDGAEPASAPEAASAPRAEPAPALEPEAATSARVSQSQARVQATPLVRRLAQELGVDLARVSGSGPNGRITDEDVRRAAGGELVTERHKPSGERREPVRGIRRQIVEHLTRAHREIPAVTFVEEADLTDVDRSLLVPLTLKAAAAALADYPELNARLEGDEIVYLDRCDIGVAVQTDQGLLVPVVRACRTEPLAALAAEVSRLAEAARAGTLKPEELRGGTFTVTSAGKLGGLLVTPLVNHPEVGILGIHRIGPRPVVRDGEVVVREVANVSVTFDHRVVDGARAAAFTLDVIRRLEAGLSS